MANISAYEKDIETLQRFLMGRAPCLALDSADIRRAERLLEQLCFIHDRPLYVTIKGKGVYSKHQGEKDYLVVRGINEPYLDTLIRELRPAPLQESEIRAVDEYFGQLEDLTLGGNWQNTTMGIHVLGDEPNTNHISGGTGPSFHGPGGVKDDPIFKNFPIPIPVQLDWMRLQDLFVPIEVHPDELPSLIAETRTIISEFLVRFRVMVRSSAGDFAFRPNPMLLVVAEGETINPRNTYAIQWLGGEDAAGNTHPGIAAQVGRHYGVDRGDPKEPAPLTECLDMISRAWDDSGIVFLMEGFRGDLPEAEGRAKGNMRQDAIRDLEAATRQLEKSVNQIVLMAPGVSWEQTAIRNLIMEYTLAKPDIDDIDEMLRITLGGMYSFNKSLYKILTDRIIERGSKDLLQKEKDDLSGLSKDEKEDRFFERGLKTISNALRGLEETKMIQLVWNSIRSHNDIDPEILDGERQKIISGVAGLTLIDPDVTFEQVGGLEALKKWIRDRGSDLFMTAEEAKAEQGGHIYKGILLIGLPGTGKSLVTKAIASELIDNDPEVSLIRLDAGALRGGIVGLTEQRTRDALATVETFAPVVLWMDEIEKAFATGGTTSSDIGTRMLGYFLTWMQERTAPVFLVATSNDVSALPPEFKREGRWDAKFYTPLPDRSACVAILKYNLGRFSKKLTLKKVVSNLQNTHPEFSSEDCNRAFLGWVNWAHARNKEGEPELIPPWQGKTPKNEDGEDAKRFQGYNGAEIEASVKEAVVTAKTNTPEGEDWKDYLTILGLLEALYAIKPVSRQTSQIGQPMANLMVELEGQGKEMLTADQLHLQKSKVLKDIAQTTQLWAPKKKGSWVGQAGKLDVAKEMKKLASEFEGLAKLIETKKEKGKRRKNPSKKEETFLLGKRLWRWY